MREKRRRASRRKSSEGFVSNVSEKDTVSEFFLLFLYKHSINAKQVSLLFKPLNVGFDKDNPYNLRAHPG